MSLILDYKGITVKEFLYPEDHFLLEAQHESYPKEINALRNSKPLLKTSNLLSLQPFLPDNLLQIVGAEWNNNFHNFIGSTKLYYQKITCHQHS